MEKNWSYHMRNESESSSVMSDSLQPHGLYSPRNSPGQNTGVGSLSLLPQDFPNSGTESRSPALQEDSLPAEPQGKPKNTAVIPYPFSSRSSWARNRTMVSCIAGRFFTNWAIREALHTEGSRFKLKGKSVKSTNLLSETLGDRHVLEFKNMWGNIK